MNAESRKIQPRPPRAILTGLLLAAGCYEGADDELQTDRTMEIVDNLVLAGFPEDDIEVELDGRVLVGGDAVVGLEASRELAGLVEPAEARFRQYRTFNLLSGSIDTICVGGATFSGGVSTALDQAIARYNEQPLDISLLRVNQNVALPAACDALITASLVSGTGGLAGFPSGGLPYSTFEIGTGIVPTYGITVASHVIMHELGHCIGLRHSDFYNRAISCGGAAYDEGPAGIGAVHVPGTPVDAVYNGSVMNSCYNGGSSGQWSVSDLSALRRLYGDGTESTCGVMFPGETLVPGEALWSCEGNVVLVYQGDGNLVLYRANGTPLWSSQTGGTSPGVTVMQDDGNLVTYSASSVPVFYTATNSPGSFLAVQGDGNMCVYVHSQPLWCTYTSL